MTRWLPLWRSLHSSVLYPLLDFLLPSICFVCDERLGRLQRLGGCPACWCRLRVLEPPLCPGCGLPRPAWCDLSGPAGGRCAACLLNPPSVDAVLAAVTYDETARGFLLKAKLGGRPELLAPLGRQLARAVTLREFARSSTMVVPVPSHPWTRLRRGFFASLLIARPVAAVSGLPLSGRALSRTWSGATAAKRLGARAREALAGRAFRANGSLDGERVLLVDDVMTSGASVGACARALKSRGAREVRAAVWARTPPAPN